MALQLWWKLLFFTLIFAVLLLNFLYKNHQYPSFSFSNLEQLEVQIRPLNDDPVHHQLLYIPNLNAVARTAQNLWPCPFTGQNRPPSWIYANLCKLGQLPTIPFAIPCYIQNLNVVARAVKKLWPCPFSRSKKSAILNLCKFMQIRAFSHNPLRHTSLQTKFERCSSNGSKVMTVFPFFLLFCMGFPKPEVDSGLIPLPVWILTSYLDSPGSYSYWQVPLKIVSGDF